MNTDDPYFLDNLKADYASACANARNYLKAYHNGQSESFWLLGMLWTEVAEEYLAMLQIHEGPT